VKGTSFIKGSKKLITITSDYCLIRAFQKDSSAVKEKRSVGAELRNFMLEVYKCCHVTLNLRIE